MTGSNDANPDLLISAHHHCKWEGILIMVVYGVLNHYSVFLVKLWSQHVDSGEWFCRNRWLLQYFIVTYEELPVLWNHTDPNYKNIYFISAWLKNNFVLINCFMLSLNYLCKYKLINCLIFSIILIKINVWKTVRLQFVSTSYIPTPDIRS